MDSETEARLTGINRQTTAALTAHGAYVDSAVGADFREFISSLEAESGTKLAVVDGKVAGIEDAARLFLESSPDIPRLLLAGKVGAEKTRAIADWTKAIKARSADALGQRAQGRLLARVAKSAS